MQFFFIKGSFICSSSHYLQNSEQGNVYYFHVEIFHTTYTNHKVSLNFEDIFIFTSWVSIVKYFIKVVAHLTPTSCILFG